MPSTPRPRRRAKIAEDRLAREIVAANGNIAEVARRCGITPQGVHLRVLASSRLQEQAALGKQRREETRIADAAENIRRNGGKYLDAQTAAYARLVPDLAAYRRHVQDLVRETKQAWMPKWSPAAVRRSPPPTKRPRPHVIPTEVIFETYYRNCGNRRAAAAALGTSMTVLMYRERTHPGLAAYRRRLREAARRRVPLSRLPRWKVWRNGRG